MNLTPSQVRLAVRLAAQAVAAITAVAVSHPAWAGAVGILTAVEAILQTVVRTVDPTADTGTPAE